MKLHYLTVQDILWVNLQATKKVHRFNYAKLEEATYYQYAYGESTGLIPQAARFLSGFARLAPFEGGNTATALLGCLGFLAINGREICLSDADADKLSGSIRDRGALTSLLESCAREGDAHGEHAPDVKGILTMLLADYSNTATRLALS